MHADQPGLLMRRRLLELLRSHGEQEIHRGTRLPPAPDIQGDSPCS
jgi:hypothetical protein